MSILSGYENQKRIVYAIMFIVVAIPILHPIGLPVEVSQYTKDFYDTIEALPEGCIVMVHFGSDAAGWSELESQVIAVTQHLMKRPVKVIFFSVAPMGSQFLDLTLKTVDLGDKIYGVDYVNVGYVGGGETGIAAIANDFHGVVNKDYYGNSIEGTFLDDVSTGRDIELCIAFESGSGGSGIFLSQFQAAFGTKVLSGATGVMVQVILPYYASGQLSGVLNSVRGGAEYEVITRNPGVGAIGTDVLTTSHLWVIASVLIGNIVYFVGKGGKK